MDRFKKLKKEKSGKGSSKVIQPLFITDVKSIKENLKIKEILRTVKMNSSMRLKAPPGSKVMNHKDFNDENCFEETPPTENSDEPLSATNPDVMVSNIEEVENEIKTDIDSKESTQACETADENTVIVEQNTSNDLTAEPLRLDKSTDFPQYDCDSNPNNIENTNLIHSVSNEKINENTRDRKLSLDHSILSRREGLSQSELDLHSIGKSKIERKSSFFKKTMNSFVKNTTEMFRKQNKSSQRRVTTSVSLQSLNDNTLAANDYREVPIQQVTDALEDCRSHLHTQSQIARSNSSLSTVQRQSSEQSIPESLASSQPALHIMSTSNLDNIDSSSAQSLNESYLKEAMLKSRAISMSSGLDIPFHHPRRKASRSNRVTWVASEGLTNYLRRVIQDEESKEIQSWQSFQDFSCIPEIETYSRKPDTKGRRLSYQRAVSGEDPVIVQRYQDSTLRRKHQIPENYESLTELENILMEFTRDGIPPLQGFEVARVPDEAFAYLLWATSLKNITETFDWSVLSPGDQSRQAVVRELINTEAEYAKHLMSTIEVFIAAAHGVQKRNRMLNIDTEKLFSIIPDILNCGLHFWNLTMVPMIKDAVENRKPFDTNLMASGFERFKEIFRPYEKYVVYQTSILEYYRSNQGDPEFSMYLSWCHRQRECNRLQLNDFLVKPMQRLTKYSLILHRIIEHTEPGIERTLLLRMESISREYVASVNRSVTQYEEMEKVMKLEETLEPYECDLKDDELERFLKSLYPVNLRAPMLYCRPYHKRCVIHQVNLRFRDGAKEADVRVILMIDMLLLCKRFSKVTRHYKLLRPKYMIDKLIQFPKYVNKNSTELASLGYVVIDDFGSPCGSFTLSEIPKGSNSQRALKVFESKVKEAKLTYEMMIWSAQNPDREMTDAEVRNLVAALHIETRVKSELDTMIQKTRERVAAMVHRSSVPPLNNWPDPALETGHEVVVGVSARPPGLYHRTHIVPRASTSGTPHPSQWATLPVPVSPISHEEYVRLSPSRRTTSLEPLMIPTTDPTTIEATPSITVQVQSDGESESATTALQVTPTLQRSPTLSRGSDKTLDSQQALRVQPQNGGTHIYSLPDLTIEPCTPQSTTSPTHPSASDKLYQSHQELLVRNRMEEQALQFLTPDQRSGGHSPSSPTRGSLKRSLAFSYSFKHPSLQKMDHVGSQSPIQSEATSQQSWSDRGGSTKPASSSEKSDKKSKLTSSRRKQRDRSEDRQSEPCRSRKGSLGPSHRAESPDLLRRDESRSASSSYKDESPGASFKDESTDLSFRDKSTSPSHRDESPATSLGYSYEKETPSSGGKTESLEISHKIDSLVLDQKIRPESVNETVTPEPFRRIDSPDPFLKDQEQPESSDSSGDNKEKLSVVLEITSETEIKEEISGPTLEMSYYDYSFEKAWISASITQPEDTPSSSRIDPVLKESKEENPVGKAESPETSLKTPSGILEESLEFSSSYVEILYRKLSPTQEDTDPGCSYKHDSSSSSLVSEEAEAIKKDDDNSSSSSLALEAAEPIKKDDDSAPSPSEEEQVP